MLSEDKRVDNAHNVAFVVRVLVLELVEEASLNEPLLVQALLVPEDLQGDHHVGLMIVTLENLTKTSFANLLLDLVAVGNVVLGLTYVLALIIIEATVLGAIRCLQRLAWLASCRGVYVVNSVKI